MPFQYHGHTFLIPPYAHCRADLYIVFYNVIASVCGGTFSLRQLQKHGHVLRELATIYSLQIVSLKPTDVGMLASFGRSYLAAERS